MEMSYAQAMSTAHGYLHRAAMATAFGDFATRDFLTGMAAEYERYADTLEREY